ncbi:MAG: NADH dehydrogenase (quinone) subunit D [Candidatus Sumerlaeia bacterium]|nr:NADH dehydrogenase (quinone) subunit D [Candidatus Sumerlaeia bacterium]
MAIRTVEKSYSNLETMTINMGPQHPSTHGVLQVILELDGETVTSLKPVLGYLHRAKEKHAEHKTYHQFIPYTDRMDYLSPMSNNTAFVMTVEKALQIEITPRCKYLRTLLCELARISAHLLAIGTGALELGAMTIFMWSFTEREKLYDIFEFISGARFTVSYMRVGGVARADYPEWRKRVRKFITEFPKVLQEMEDMMNGNEIFLQRVIGVGKISGQEALDLGLSGPTLRGSGIDWDIRKDNPYLAYEEFDWEVAVETEGDCMSRYLVRMKEMYQSTKIAMQALDALEKHQDQPMNIDNPKVIFPSKDRVKKSMEDLIHHFLLASEGFKVPPAEVYHSIEAPKGELGFHLVSDGSSKAYRLGIKSPSFNNLQGLRRMGEGALLADVVAIIASIDPVMGEVDR